MKNHIVFMFVVLPLWDDILCLSLVFLFNSGIVKECLHVSTVDGYFIEEKKHDC